MTCEDRVVKCQFGLADNVVVFVIKNEQQLLLAAARLSGGLLKEGSEGKADGK